MDSIIVNSTTLNGQRGGIFTIQISGGIQREFSRVFVVKTLDVADGETGERIVQIASHLEDEVFKTIVSKWTVNGHTFTDSVSLTNALEEVVWEAIKIPGDEVTGATVNGEEVFKDIDILRFNGIARTADVEELEQRVGEAEQQLDENTSAIETNTQAISDIHENISNIEAEVSAVTNQTTINTSDIAGIKQELAETEHFRGYYATTAELATTPNPRSGDFAYSAETGTRWIYNGTIWENTGDPVPDQMVPKSTSIPLMDGVASIGVEEAYAAGDHRHPTDTTRASQITVGAIQTNINNIPNLYVAKAGDTMTGQLTVPNIVLTSTIVPLQFSRASANYIRTPANGYFVFLPNNQGTGIDQSSLVIQNDIVFSGKPLTTLGSTVYPWENVYANTFTGNLTGNASGYSTYVLTSAMSNANNSMKASQGLYYSFQSQSSNWGAASGHGIRLQRSVGTNQTSSQSILDIQTATGSSEDIYVRKAYGSDSTNTITYLPWRTLIHSGNISSYTGAYLPLTGGTMAGNINMSTRLTITSTGTFILHLVV